MRRFRKSINLLDFSGQKNSEKFFKNAQKNAGTDENASEKRRSGQETKDGKRETRGGRRETKDERRKNADWIPIAMGMTKGCRLSSSRMRGPMGQGRRPRACGDPSVHRRDAGGVTGFVFLAEHTEHTEKNGKNTVSGERKWTHAKPRSARRIKLEHRALPGAATSPWIPIAMGMTKGCRPRECGDPWGASVCGGNALDTTPHPAFPRKRG